MYNNYASNPYMMQQPAYAPRRQEQPIGQGFGFGANNFFGAGSSFLGNQFGQTSGAGYGQFGAGSSFTNPSSFFNSTQNASQSASIDNRNTMNVNFGSGASQFASQWDLNDSGYIDWSRPRPTGLTPYPPGYGGSGKPPMPYGNDALIPSYGGNYCNPYIPAQPMPQPPVVPYAPYCPPTYTPPKPPVYPPPVHPPAPPVQTNFVGLAGDPEIYDATGKKVTVQQNTGFRNLYANGEGFAGNAAGGQLAGILNRQVALGDAQAAVKEANASGLFQGGVPAGGIAVNSLVEQLNAKEPNKVANTQYGVTVGDYKVQLAGGLTQVIKPDGTTVTLKPDGTPFQLGNLATLRAGVTLPGAGEARTVLAYNEALRQGGTSTDLLTWGFRMPDGLGATERASAGFADGVQRLDSNGNRTYYDFQVIQNAQANQRGGLV
jgi:hypothetical protein